jgi:putative sigma-54 modulation protein
VLVHDRTDGLPARLEDYAQKRLQRLGRHFDRILEVEVEFGKPSGRASNAGCSVAITVQTDGRRHSLAHAHETALDARAALDLALDKIDRQLVKLKEKIKIEKKRAAAVAVAGAHAQAEEPEAGRRGEPERLRLPLRPESLADAEAALDDGRPFYVFLDETSGAVSVCYRRPDGGLTVIEPVVT